MPNGSERARNCPTPLAGRPDVQNLVGLALSGGGIRSATFNLGVLQGLQSRNALRIFDYLSTVSGGGFIGAWWSAWLSRQGRAAGVIFPSAEELEPQRRQETALLLDPGGGRSSVPSLPDASLIARRDDPIHFVRLFSNYLTPKTGAFSPDTWRLIAFYLRNLLLTWSADRDRSLRLARRAASHAYFFARDFSKRPC
jgi:predicted acylesterase/phospholipase RssA